MSEEDFTRHAMRQYQESVQAHKGHTEENTTLNDKR